MSEYLHDDHLEFLKEVPDNDLNALAEILQYKENNQNVDRWKAIATEIQTYGGDTIANTVRGHGVPYKEILQNICYQLKILKTDDVYEMENDLLAHVLHNKSLERGTAQEIIEYLKNPPLEEKQKINCLALLITTSKVSASVNTTARTIQLVGGSRMSAWAWAAPAAILSLTMLPIFSGPAYRITLFACLHVACLRRKLLDDLLEKNCNIYPERG